MKKAAVALQGWASAHPRAIDLASALAIFLAAVVSSRASVDLLRQTVPGYTYEATEDLAGLALVTLPLALRRSAPLASLLACCAGFVLARQLLGGQESNMVTFALSLAFYSAAVHAGAVRRSVARDGVVVLCAALVLGEVAWELSGAAFAEASLAYLVFAFAYNLALIVAMWVLGRLRAAALRRNVELADRTRELLVERERNARRAVLDERVRIARELHDVVAHHVSVIGVQAGAARAVMSREPERAAQVLSGIEEESRSAVAEMQRLLGVLRQPGDGDDLAPQPGVAQLPGLVAAVEQSGLAVTLDIAPTALPVSPTVDASIYRIVQEALTNAIKHSGGSTARVRLERADDAVALTVVDDGAGRAASQPAAGQGLGLVGMRERAAVHGGSLEAGPQASGGYRVHATFPQTQAAAVGVAAASNAATPGSVAGDRP